MQTGFEELVTKGLHNFEGNFIQDMALALQVEKRRIFLLTVENNDPVEATVEILTQESAMETLMLAEELMSSYSAPDSIVFSDKLMYRFNPGVKPKIFLGNPPGPLQKIFNRT